MRNNLIHRAGIKAIVFAIALIVSGIGGFISYGQRNNKSTVSQSVDDPYSMSPDSRFKPEMRYFIVRLKGDNGISIIDLNGNVISRNVLPVTNSQGKIIGSYYSNPVINDLFCIERAKEPGKSGIRLSIYRNALRPTPIEGLTDLYSANIINPNLFAISRYGERIKFVDSNGNEKFTVMPIDGKEPYEVSPVATNGVIIVTVCSVVKKKDHMDYIEKKGAIDTNGKWVVYPEWDSLESLSDGVFVGFKGQELYKIKNGKAVRDTRFDNFGQLQYHEYPIKGNYIIEIYGDNHKCAVNIYDLKQNYITTIDNTEIIWPNRLHPNILCVRNNFRTTGNDSYYLLDLDNNTVISKDYKTVVELPDGNYLAIDYINNTRKYWYVNVNGTASPLPVNSGFPIRSPGMALLYDTEIKRLIVPKGDDGTPGYICDFNGNKVGNLLIDEYYNFNWGGGQVRSGFWRKYIIDK